MPRSLTTSTHLDRPGVFTGIQALRFVAAMMVVITHATFFVGERVSSDMAIWEPGSAGVDIFFVISGFVMAIASADLIGQPGAWREFAYRRLIRIAPPYWLATTLKVAIVAALPAVTLHSELNLPHLLASYLFLPTLNGENEMKPILAVGWTLVFEMFFYAMFALALALKIRPLTFTGVLFVLMAMIAPFRTEHWPIITAWFDTILLEFLFGMLIAVWIQRGARVPALMASAMAIAGFAGVILLNNDNMYQWRFAYQGLPAALLVAGVAALEPALRARLPRVLQTLGDASYSLYLFHSFAVPALAVIAAKLQIGIWPALLLATIAPVPMSVLAYRWFELPVLRWFKQQRQRRSARAVAANQAG